jgi:peroxiredoxin
MREAGGHAVEVLVVSVDSKYTLAAWARQTGTDVVLAVGLLAAR